MSRTIGIIQARLGSTRLPGKALLKIGDKSVLGHCITTARQVRGLDEVVVATGPQEQNFDIFTECDLLGCNCFSYPVIEDNVLLRFIFTAVERKADYILRICADAPFFNVPAAEELVQYPFKVDYVAHWLRGESLPTVATYGLGYFVELVKTSALIKAYYETDQPHDLEHVTPYIYTHMDKFDVRGLLIDELPTARLAIDTEEDLERVRQWYEQQRS